MEMRRYGYQLHTYVSLQDDSRRQLISYECTMNDLTHPQSAEISQRSDFALTC